jgi:thiosulfate reductase cytochrome b subunit
MPPPATQHCDPGIPPAPEDLMKQAETAIIHPAWLRLLHWLNALAFVLLMLSGWRIYNASPVFGFRIPSGITLGDWLGGALLWHFAAMWLLAGNALLYLALNLGSGRLWRRFLPVDAGLLWRELGAALRGRLAHSDPRHYNQVQRLAYLFSMVDILVLVLSGLVLWKSVQFPLLRELLGGYEFARRWHFLAMSGGLAFLLLHLAMAVLFPATLRAMVRGR